MNAENSAPTPKPHPPTADPWVTADGVRRVAVLGAGLMGSGIAQVFAQAGYEVRLWARRGAGHCARAHPGQPADDARSRRPG